MRLANHTELFSLGGVPAIANYKTGGLIGLTADGLRLCKAMQEGDVAHSQIPASCEKLAEHLKCGSYLDEDAETQTDKFATKRRAYLHITQRCNLNCRFCYSKCILRNHLADPSLVDLKRAIDLLAIWKATHLVISGGEPFLRDDLPEVILYAKETGIDEITLVTNGTLIEQSTLVPFASTVNKIAISFDGWSPTSPAWLRGEQRFEILKQKLELVSRLGIKPHIIVTLHHKNVDDVSAYRALAANLGASLSFSLLLTQTANDFMLSEEELAALGREEIANASQPSLSCRKTCGAGVTSLSIDADGNVYPCHMLHQPEFAMGNAFTDTMECILCSNVARQFKSLDSRAFDNCQSCRHRPICGGGCRARAFYSRGSLEADDPYCALSDAYYSEFANLISERYSKTGDKDAF